MSVIKKALCLTLACAAFGVSLASAAVQYSTQSVDTGAFTRKGSFNGSVYYQQSRQIPFGVPGATLTELLITPGQTVQAGDIVASYVSPMNGADIRRAETVLAQAEDDYQYELERRTLLIEEYRAASEAADNQTDARIQELLAQREELLLTEYVTDTEANISALTAARDAAIASTEPVPIFAPITGTVDSVAQLTPGAAIPAGKSLAGIFAPETALIRVDNSAGDLKYGMRVELKLSSRSAQFSTIGTVVSCDNVLPGALRSGVACIVPDEIPTGEGYGAVSATAETMRIENVPLVPNSALQLRNGRHYVRILGEDGVVHTRYVRCAMASPTASWVAVGAVPGDKLITK